MCFGCEQSFCTKHFIEHRLQLATQMDDLTHQYKVFEQSLEQAHQEHPSIAAIYAWERKSMRKIQEIAEQARENLVQSIEKAKTEVHSSLRTMTTEFHTPEHGDNYTETDLQRWTDRLAELRVELDKIASITMIEDKRSSLSIGTLKFREPSRSSAVAPLATVLKTKAHTVQPPANVSQEHFVHIFGQCKLSEENLLATQVSYRAGLSQLCGINEYSSGKHSIRFLIEKKGMKNLFIGIHSPSAQATATNFDTSVHGWWNLDYRIVNGQSEGNYDKEVLQTGDQVTLILNCDRQQILFEHHRTNRRVHLPIDLLVCPFPWKLFVRLLTSDDSLRILK